MNITTSKAKRYAAQLIQAEAQRHTPGTLYKNLAAHLQKGGSTTPVQMFGKTMKGTLHLHTVTDPDWYQAAPADYIADLKATLKIADTPVPIMTASLTKQQYQTLQRLNK